MQRRLRLISTILASCLAIVMLGFGVYAALTQVTYDIEGTISYNVTDTYVEVNTKIYKSETLLTKAQLADKVEQVANLSFADIASDTSLTHLSALDDTFTNVSNLSDAGEYSKGEDLDFTFATSGENVAFAYFIVMNVANLTQNPIYAVMQDDILDVTNTFQYNNALQENILSTEDNRNIVIGIIVDDRTTPIAENSPFSYGINIGSGDVADTAEMKAKYTTEGGLYALTSNAKGVVVLKGNSVSIEKFGGMSGNSNITALVFRSGLNYVENYSFAYNTNLTKLVIPGDSNLNFDGGQMCEEGTISIYTLVVEECENPKYTSRNDSGQELNCVIDISNPDSQVLVQGTANTKWELLPEKITSIGTMAFECCLDLTSATIPQGVETIGYFAFSGCVSLTNITIPDSITSIGNSAFSNWTAEQSIYFEGTSMPENLVAGWNDGCNAKIYLNGELWTGA